MRSTSNAIGIFIGRMMIMQTGETTGTPQYSPGLDGVLAGESALCHVDEGEGGLRYCGYAVSELAEKATFEEVAYLLLHGELPSQKELKDFAAQMAAQSTLHGHVQAFLEVVPPTAHPMDIDRKSVV